MGNILVKFVNFLISAVGNALSFILSVLPKSPFHFISNSSVKNWLGYLNWIVPVPYIVTFLETWLVAIALFYAYSVFARWVKMIQ